MPKLFDPSSLSRQLSAISLFLLLTAPGALAQNRPGGDRPNFDVRSILSRTQPSADSKTGEEDARKAQRIDLQQRLATTRTEAGDEVRYSLGVNARLKLLSAGFGALTAPSVDDPAKIVLDWLAAHQDLFGLTSEDLASAAVTTELSSTGLRFVSVEQVIDGLPVLESTIRVAVDSQGGIVQVQGSQAERVVAVAPFTDDGPSAAIAAAFAAVGVRVERQAQPIDLEGAVWSLYSNPEDALPPVQLRRTAFPLGTGAALAAYRIAAMTSAGSYDVIVAAQGGRMLYRVRLESHLGQARVWPHSPVHGDRELVPFGEGWLAEGATTTKGNNADAYLDMDGNDQPDRSSLAGLSQGRAFSENQVFDFPSGDGLGKPSSYAANAVTHAFYQANAAHDYFYELGFREKDGNFQTNNFGKGGSGGDHVKLQVQTPETPGNASFATLPDGNPGVMRLGVDLLDTGSRDFSLSGQTIFHEYAHGVTSRMVGGRLNVSCLFLSGQGDALSEAWSDYFAASRFNEPVSGEYETGDAVKGLRRFALDQTPWKFWDLGNEGLRPHNDGEIFAAVLWDLRAALGAGVTDRLVFSALALTPCDPSFVDARDAILTADQTLNAGANLRAIWTAFAARGLGFGSKGADSATGALETRFDGTTDLPAQFGGTNRSPVVTSEPTEYARVTETVTYTIQATDPEGDSWTVQMLEAPANATFDTATRRLRWRPTFTSGRFVFSVKDSLGNETRHGFVWWAFSIITLQNSVKMDGMAGSSGIVGVIVDEQMPLLQITTRSGQGNPDILVWPPLVGEFTGNNFASPDETITFADPLPGLWIVFVDGITEYAGVNLRARELKPVNVEAGKPASNLSDSATSERAFRVLVPSGAERLHVQLSGGSGDADLFVAKGRLPLCPQHASIPCDFDQSSEAAGNYESLVIQNPAAGEWFITVAGRSAYQGVSLLVSTSPASKLNAAVEGAAFQPFLAPGGISTLFGENFANPGVEAVAGSLPLPTVLAGIRVLVNGVPAPLFYVSATQINFQNPFESPLLEADILVERDGLLSNAFEASVDPDVPRFFTFSLNGQSEPVVTHADGNIVTPASPAKPGEVLIAYLTGVGSLLNPPATGAPAAGDPLTTTAVLPTVVVNGVEVVADFSGWSPGYVGLIQVNFAMPPNLPAGARVPIQIRYGPVTTQSMTIAVE